MKNSVLVAEDRISEFLSVSGRTSEFTFGTA